MKMIINVKKENDDIVLSLTINDKPMPFDYVTLVNALYNKNKIEDIVYSDNINDWEKEEISKLVEQIKTAVKQLEEES